MGSGISLSNDQMIEIVQNEINGRYNDLLCCNEDTYHKQYRKYRKYLVNAEWDHKIKQLQKIKEKLR